MRPGLVSDFEQAAIGVLRELRGRADQLNRGEDVAYPTNEKGQQTAAPDGGQAMCSRAYSDDELLKELFSYHAPTQEKQKQYETIRDAALHLGRVILKNTPHGADRTAAIRHLREAVMTANGGIALDGLSL